MSGVDLVQWLGAQLDEDERIARAATWCDEAASWHAEPSPFGARDNGQRWYVEDAMDDGVVSHVDPVASDDEGVARHIAEWDPARVLREVEADRLLLAEYERAANEYPADSKAYDHESTVGRERTATLEWVVRLRATRFSDRPGYRPEWAPTA